ncbi:GIY-YIG nuclease family protein [Carboxylicivirga sp. A043]|uniref:GIY-YIG nuclease family protein n=1 Tax=Carboxylicivirga litoralis TaxID=2816963 RepID=UPI0039676D21|nr:GIY-YIG nuclease family protein [Carboxylicivirga sp. A043]
MKYFVYIIYSPQTDSYYIGQTQNIEQRIQLHNSGHFKNCSTKFANDWEIFFLLECNSRKQALAIEKHIKKNRNRNYYNNLVKYPEISHKLLLKYL